MLGRRAGEGRLTLPSLSQLLAVALAMLTTAYIVWKVTQSSEQALQFAFNGLSVGAVYALLAMGFTLVYSTVWFFDLYYGAAAALGAYGVFYLRSQGSAYGFEANGPLRQHCLCSSDGGSHRLGPAHRAVLPAAGPGRPPCPARHRRRHGRCRRGLRGICAGLPRCPEPHTQPCIGSSYSRGGGLGPLSGVTAGLEPVPSRRSSFPAALAAAIGAYCGFLVANAPGSEPVSELGGVVPVGGDRGTGPVPRPVRVHAPTVQLASGHAGRVPWHPAGHHRLHNDSVQKRAAPAAGGVRQRPLDHRRG